MEAYLSLLNNQHFASCELFSFSGCPAQVEGIAIEIAISLVTFSRYTVTQYMSHQITKVEEGTIKTEQGDPILALSIKR